MTRADLQQLADVRIAEAMALLSAGFPDGAYYLAGYAVECALKACVAKLTNQYDFPDRDVARKAWTHNLVELVQLAGLKARLDADAPVGSPLWLNWSIVRDWSEGSRYERKTLNDAQGLFNAITDATNGMLPWVKNHW